MNIRNNKSSNHLEGHMPDKIYNTWRSGALWQRIKQLEEANSLGPDEPVFIVADIGEPFDMVFCVMNVEVGEHNQVLIRVEDQQTILERDKGCHHIWVETSCPNCRGGRRDNEHPVNSD